MIIHSFSFNKTAMPIQVTQFIKSYGLWLCLLAAALPVYAAPQVVGHISFVKGSNAAQLPGAAPRILGKDTEIFQGDNIQTTERSFVIIEFTDGAKVTVRPNSNFSIDHYDGQSGNKTAQLELHEGSVQASTGDIAKGDPKNFQIKTPTGTVKPGSEKAEFAIQVCDEACAKNAQEVADKKERTEESIVARVVDIKGEVVAKKLADKNAKDRPLSVGKPLYNSDTLYSEKDSYALVVFPDGQKVTLAADSEMEIKKYIYNIKDKKDQVLFRLAAGGMRMLTGSIGKNDHDAFALNTPVATIGIRGSAGDLDASGVVTTTEGELTSTDPDGNTTSVPAGFTLLPDGTLAPSTPNDLTRIKGADPRTDKTNSKDVIKEPTKARGDTSVSSISGKTTVESNDGKNTKTVEEGKTSTTSTNGETTINSDNGSSGGGSSGDGTPGSGGTSGGGGTPGDGSSGDGC
jgi:hypothetical protein